jgi:hypothetical protein
VAHRKKKLQLDQLGERRIGHSQGIEGIGERIQIRNLRDLRGLGVERGQVEGTAALEGPSLADVVDDQGAHRPGRVGEEARPVGKREGALAEVQIGLVQQCGGAERQAAGAGA